MTASARVARDSAGLLAGTLVNGAFAYVFFAQATRGLGAAGAAPVAVLWTYWGVATAVITFPVQHWIIRTLKASGEDAVGQALPRMFASVTAFSVVATGLAWLADEQLFLQNGPVFPLLVGLVTIGSFFTGVVRGGLAGRERFGATALALAADNIVRVILAFFVLRAGGGAVSLGVVLVSAALIGLLWPSGYRYRRDQSAERLPSSLAFLGAVATGSLIGQFVLIGGPAVLAGLGGAPRDVTMLFATLAFFRAPYLLAVGIANRVTGALTGWVNAGLRDTVRTFLLVVSGLSVAGAVLAPLAAYAVGATMVGAVFGADTTPPDWVAAVVAAGSVFAVGNLALSLLVIAQGRGGRLTRAWVAAAVVVALVLGLVLVVGSDPLAGVTWSFLAGEFAAFAILLVSGWRTADQPAVAGAPAPAL